MKKMFILAVCLSAFVLSFGSQSFATEGCVVNAGASKAYDKVHNIYLKDATERILGMFIEANSPEICNRAFTTKDGYRYIYDYGNLIPLDHSDDMSPSPPIEDVVFPLTTSYEVAPDVEAFQGSGEDSGIAADGELAGNEPAWETGENKNGVKYAFYRFYGTDHGIVRGYVPDLAFAYDENGNRLGKVAIADRWDHTTPFLRLSWRDSNGFTQEALATATIKWYKVD